MHVGCIFLFLFKHQLYVCLFGYELLFQMEPQMTVELPQGNHIVPQTQNNTKHIRNDKLS